MQQACTCVHPATAPPATAYQVNGDESNWQCPLRSRSPHSHPTGPGIQQVARQAGVATPDTSRMLILFHVLLAGWAPIHASDTSRTLILFHVLLAGWAPIHAPDTSRMLILFHVLLAGWIPSLRRPSWSVGRGRPVVRLYRSIWAGRGGGGREGRGGEGVTRTLAGQNFFEESVRQFGGRSRGRDSE